MERDSWGPQRKNNHKTQLFLSGGLKRLSEDGNQDKMEQTVLHQDSALAVAGGQREGALYRQSHILKKKKESLIFLLSVHHWCFFAHITEATVAEIN